MKGLVYEHAHSRFIDVAGDDAGNRLVYVDEFCDPYYVNLQTPTLVTPQWIGEKGVEAVIVLANDDLSESAKHEQYLRPWYQKLSRYSYQPRSCRHLLLLTWTKRFLTPLPCGQIVGAHPKAIKSYMFGLDYVRLTPSQPNNSPATTGLSATSQ